MTVVKLSSEEMRAFAEEDARDPAIAKLKELSVRYATEAGGVTLAVWRLAQGQFFGLPDSAPSRSTRSMPTAATRTRWVRAARAARSR